MTQIPLQFCLAATLVVALVGCHAGHAEEGRATPRIEASALQATDGVKLLGGAPLCEPSALARAPWDPDVILVGDNEVDDQLFAFSLEDGSLLSQHALALPDHVRPHDLEALVAIGQDEVLLVGSHSRNKHCELKPKRHRLQSIKHSRAAGELEAGDSIDTVADGLFESAESCIAAFPASPLGEAACVALIEAQARADRRSGEEACDVFDIEGAAYVDGHVWLGLRGPLSDGQALLLRLVWPADSLRFDGVALVDLRGARVREMAVADGLLYLIAGPLEDDDEFALWSTPLSALEAGATLHPTRLRVLPDSSEGLLIEGDRALVVIDGDKGPSPWSCTVDGQQAILPLHPDASVETP